MKLWFLFHWLLLCLWYKLPATNLRGTKGQMVYLSSGLWLERDDSWGSFFAGSLQKDLVPAQRLQKPEVELKAPSPSLQSQQRTSFRTRVPHPKVYTT